MPRQLSLKNICVKGAPMGVGGGGPSLPGGLEMRGTKWNVLGDSQCQPVVRLVWKRSR